LFVVLLDIVPSSINPFPEPFPTVIMKFSAITTILALTLSALAAPTPQEEPSPPAAIAPDPQAPKLPKILKYDQRQSNNAWAIIAQIKAEKFSKADALTACKAAFATAITESNIYIYAKEKVPSSLKIHHDKVGKDNDSVGIYQQRAKYYKVEEAMSPAKSTHSFFGEMKKVGGWQKAKTAKQIGVVCQKVQRSGKRLEDG
jgi:hypothetical protein